MKHLFKNLVSLLILGIFVYSFRGEISNGLTNIKRQYLPCQFTTYYSIGKLDSGFGVSREEFLQYLNEAADKWNNASGRELLAYRADGPMNVNLVYDTSQATTDKLSDLSGDLDSSKTAYDVLKAEYNALLTDYKSEKATFDKAYKYFTQKNNDYNQEVAHWNSLGGATREVYIKLNQVRTELAEEANALKDRQEKLNNTVARVNSLARELNTLAKELNIQVSNYNEVSGAESSFEEGQYVRDSAGERIDIYQFDDSIRLKRVLAHEFGHSLGLDHVEDKDAIMYFLNSSQNEKLTKADINELQKVCSSGLSFPK